MKYANQLYITETGVRITYATDL